MSIVFLQITKEIQNLSVSSTTTNTSNIVAIANILRETTITTSGGKPQSLAQRIKFLQQQLAHAPMPSVTSKRRQLPSIEEAWNLPISNEMSSRQQQSQSQQRQYQQQKSTTTAGYGQVSIHWSDASRSLRSVDVFRQYSLMIV